MASRKTKESGRQRRKKRTRKKIIGTGNRPRLCVFRSARHIYAQVIDDTVGETLAAASTLSKELKDRIESHGNIEAAKEVGKLIAQKTLEKNIGEVVFDRNGYLYHGRVKALASSAREGGLKF